MANPNDAVGTNGAFGGRTSVNAFNDVLSAFSGRGILSGWACNPSSGLTVTLGGDGSDRDVAIAEDASGNKTTINNISQAPVPVTVNPAPASNSRIDAIVAYIEDSPNGSGITDNPDVVNMLVVSGTVASSPVAPSDTAIRSAITADGASGSTAYYVVLATVRIPTGTTDIDSTMITSGANAQLGASKFNFASLGNYYAVPAATDIQLADNTEATLVSFQATQSGTFFLIGKCNIDVVSSSGTFCVSQLTAQNAVVGTTITSPGADNRIDVTIIGWVNAKAGDTITFKTSVSNTTGTARQERTRLAAIRVA